jgi:BirA family biotin operon repressor/biotin-[acetyl-CoA-carboxylase] ligase
MPIIKLNAIDSTNNYLKQLSIKEEIEDFTCVVAKHQTQGRGQRGTKWSSEDSKNLMCSVFKRNSGIAVGQQFFISIATSLAIIRTLQSFNIPKLFVKWPNDILSDNKKICGILIENVIKQTNLDGSVIGIGLNVNQTRFPELPNAASLKTLMGRVFDTEELLHLTIKNLKLYFDQIEKEGTDQLKRAYEKHLFRIHKPSTFLGINGKRFSGFIKGINDEGNLLVLLEDNILKSYGMKEIQLLY